MTIDIESTLLLIVPADFIIQSELDHELDENKFKYVKSKTSEIWK